MGELKRVLVVMLVCFFALTNAAMLTVSTLPPVTIGVTSSYIFVSAPQPPTGAFTVAVTASAGSTIISPSTLSFDPATNSASFTVFTTDTTPVTLTFTLSGNSDTITAPNPITFPVRLRTVVIDPITSLPVDTPSEPLQITVAVPSTGDLTFTPTTTASDVVFNAASYTIPAGSLSTSYSVYYSDVFNAQLVTITWGITGDEGAYYTNSTPNFFISATIRQVAVSAFPANVLMGDNSTVLYAYTTDTVNNTITVVPQAADTVFNPSTLVFSPGVQVVPFTFNSTTPASPKKVYFSIEETQTDYAYPPTQNVVIQLKSVTLVAPTTYIQNKHTQISVRIAAPVVSDLTVALFAANLVFNQTSVTFTGTTTAILVDVWPIARGPDSISTLLTGTDAIYYATPGAILLSVTRGAFIGLTSWYTPDLWLGVTSDNIPVRVSVAPTTNVTVTPVAPDLVFNPPSITFTPTVLEQSFTITPTFTNTALGSGFVSSSNVKFLVTGGDWSLYDIPADSSVTVNRRQIQITWTPYLTDSTLYLGSTYRVWATANYVDSPITVTPTNPYLTFNPPVLQFTSSTLQVKFTVTVNAVVASTDITYLIGGVNGGLYQTISVDTFTTSLRSFSFNTAVIAPDSRVAATNAILVQNPTPADLGQNHVYSFSLLSTVVPTSSLTITPVSLHITFFPTSLTFNTAGLTTVFSPKEIYNGETREVNSNNILANFNVTAKSSGTHEVWFKLDGPDATYYVTPPHTYISFWMDDVPPTAASARVIASASMLLVVILTILV